jgi:hypothetical protein
VKRYVVMGLRGGLGNQLFQFASGYGIARHLGATLLFDDTLLPDSERWLPGLVGPIYRQASRKQLLRVGVWHATKSVRDHAIRAALVRVVDRSRHARGMTPRSLPFYDSPGSAGRYEPTVLSMDLPTELLGWFQTERYFADVAHEVVEHLRLPDVQLHPPTSRPVVALSFRRGDYVRMGWELPFSYYERALELVMEKVPDATFLVFGDDREFVRMATEWVTRYGPATNAYDFSDGALDQLVLASRCDHAVIANSSYAWWGAWLGDQRAESASRLVLAPVEYRERFGPDILPDRWIAVPS